MRPFLFFLVILLISAGEAYTQSARIDSLSKAAAGQPDPSRLAEIYGLLSREYLRANIDSSSYYAGKSLELARGADDNQQLAKSLGAVIYTLLERRKLDSAKVYLTEAEKLHETIEDPRLLSVFYNYYGTYHFYNGQTDRAIEMYYKSVEYDEIIGDPKLKLRSYGNKGIMLNNAGRKNEALKSYTRAIEMADELSDKAAKMQLLVNVSSLYSYSKSPYQNLDTAIYLSRQALEIARELNSTFGLAKINSGLASALIRNHQPQEGLEAAVAAKNYFESAGIRSEYQLAMLNEAFAHEALGNPDRAIEISNTLLSDKGFMLPHECHRLLYLAFRQKNDPKAALTSFEKYKAITDSLSSLEKEKALAELQTKYESGQKEAEISRLGQEAAIQALELSKQKVYFWGLGIVFILVMVTAWVYYKQVKAKQEKLVIQMEQKALRSQMNPHFIFNALGAIQNFMLQSKDPLETASYLTGFARLMRQILENSREEYILLADEIDTLENYLRLQALRFRGKFDYSLEVSGNIDPEAIKIPPMFAQPFIENALEHGISNLDRPGHIKILFDLKGDQVMLTIKDNGEGIKNEALKEKQHKSLATTIAKERVALINNSLRNKITFQVENLDETDELGVGTKVMLSLPYR